MDNKQQVSHRGDGNSAPHIGFRLDADLPPAYHPQNQQFTPNFAPASGVQTNSPPHAPPGVDVVVSSQPRIVSVGTLHGLPHEPTTFTCPNCSKVVSTKVEHKATGKTHCWALCFCCFLCWPCVCVPYCSNSCQTAEHFCTECGTYMGNSENSR